jgi:tetratricopeptide (TPR) repeat protein
MDEIEPFDAATEDVAVHVLRHLEWQPDVFSLMFLFADVGPALRLATWLDAQLTLADRPLQRFEVAEDFVVTPERAVDALVDSLTERTRHPGAIWYGLQRHPADDRWNAARRRFIARINERRFLLERDLKRPLILVLPTSARAEVAAMAPDLWHIRTASHLLRADGRRQAVDLPQAIERQQEGNALVSHGTPAFDEWRNATLDAAPGSVFLPLSQPAIEELLAAGRPADAMAVARNACDIAQSRVVDHGPPEALRDLSVSLDNVGKVAHAQGDWALAERVYRDSLEISRQLIDRLGGTPDALRDLSVSLDNVGEVASAQGDWAQAERVYRESQEISRELIDRLGGTPEALRDLSISLNNVGRVARAQGDWAQAERVYRESLEIRRQLIDLIGGTPEARRDLSISLDNVGHVASAQGDWAQAERVYRESLEIRRQLIDRLGSTPEALRDLSISLNNVGRVASAQGDWAQAERVYRESLEIRRQLIDSLGGTPEALDDVDIALFNLGSLPQNDQTTLAEAATLYRDLTHRFPTVANYRRRLSQIESLIAGKANDSPES